MNRKQRRAAVKQSSRAPAIPARSAADPVPHLFAEAVLLRRQMKLEAAARTLKRLLQIEPGHAMACNDLACVLQAQGKLDEAAGVFAQTLMLKPQFLGEFKAIFKILLDVLPALGEAMTRAAAAWPQVLAPEHLFAPRGLAAVADNPLLLLILKSVPVRDVGFERLLTSLRRSFLDNAVTGRPNEDAILNFCAALAQQCFINEYVFATTAEEDAQRDALKRSIATSATDGAEIDRWSVAVLAMYEPLNAAAFADALLERVWPPSLDAVLTQQIREPRREQALRASIPRLTPIEDAVSQRVRDQYEEHPYPRWTQTAAPTDPVPLGQHLRTIFPAVPFVPPGKTEGIEVLIAGCGTGSQAVAVAQMHPDTRLLAVDLSLASLAYATRSTPEALMPRIDYAQADILKLGSLGRSFDVVYSTGVLHHMADPFAGWRLLVSLLRPDGLMNLGFYSELARTEIVAARAFIAEHGYEPTSAGIRRCRQDLLASPLRGVAQFNDFFTTSECRDLLFHVQETRVTIPQIKGFLTEHGLRFLGFEFDVGTQERLRSLFAQKGWSLTDLDCWHAVETNEPALFAGMYQFWVQKR
jgi:2-polyprenyl-3-methyl-5-hydroxy-6-metoxy-1,4-benzoquinol methylase